MEEIKELEKFEKTRGKLRLPPDLKPCIASLLDSPSAKDGINPFIIACELHRTCKSDEKIGAILLRLGVTPSKARNAIQSAATGKYSFGCLYLEQEGLCRYERRFQCWWYNKIPRQSQKNWRERDFWRYGWPKKLGRAATVIYLAAKEVEKKRRIYAGSWLYVSRDELSKLTGVSPPWAVKCCERLEEMGLIRFKKGKQHRWYGQAGQIQRIIPIPKPKM